MSTTIVDPNEENVPAAHDFSDPDKISAGGATIDIDTGSKDGEGKDKKKSEEEIVKEQKWTDMQSLIAETRENIDFSILLAWISAGLSFLPFFGPLANTGLEIYNLILVEQIFDDVPMLAKFFSNVENYDDPKIYLSTIEKRNETYDE